MNKKGQIQTLAPAVLALVFAGIVLVFGLVMSQELTDTQYVLNSTCNQTSGIYTGCPPAYKGGNKTVAGLGSFTDFWEIIVLAIVITVVIGLLLIVFGGRRTR